MAFDRAQPYWLDVEAAAAALDAGDAAADPDALKWALALLERELLAGFVIRGAPAFDDWLRGERQRWRELYVGALLRTLEVAALDGLPFEDVTERLGIELEDRHYATLGGYVFGLLGRLPHVGAEVLLPAGQRLRVDALDGARVARVVLTPPEAANERQEGQAV